MQYYLKGVVFIATPSTTNNNTLMNLSRLCITALFPALLCCTALPIWSETSPPVVNRMELAKNGQSEFAILLPRQADHIMTSAAHELADYMKESTGATLPVIREEDRNTHSGKWFLLEQKVDDPKVPLEPQGFLISTEGNDTVIIRSRSSHGVLYGVYAFLEKGLGCRWFAPDETKVPKHPVLTMPDICGSEAPFFGYRDIYARDVFNDRLWAQRIRINPGCPPNSNGPGTHLFNYLPGYSVHTFNKLVPPDKYFKEHPEYYGLGADGKRNPQLLCLSNPAVFETALQTLNKDLEQYPKDKWIISISQNDCGGWCQCDECRRIIDQEEGGIPTGLLMRFLNSFDEALKGRDIIIHSLAYADSDIPPTKTRPNKDVIIQLCPIGICYGHAPGQCEHKANTEFNSNLKGWSAIHRNLWIWSYHINFAHILQPFPNIHTLGVYVRQFADNHVTGVFAQCDAMSPSASLSKLKHYILAKLLWNPYQDENMLIREFVNNYYKSAAPVIMEYLELLKNTISARTDIHTWLYEDHRAAHLNPEFTLQAEQIFAKGLAGIKPDTADYKRLKTEQLSISYLVLSQWKDGMLQKPAEEILTLLNDFEAGSEQFHIHGLTEHDWDKRLKKEWAQSIRDKAASQKK